MSKLKREAVGQYNFVVSSPQPQKGARRQIKHNYPDFYPHTDVTVEIIDPTGFALSNIKPPKMFETNYTTDYRHPPAINLLPYKSHNDAKDDNYTAYAQKIPKSKTDQKVTLKLKLAAPVHEKNHTVDRNAIRSAEKTTASHVSPVKTQAVAIARSQTAEPKTRLTAKEDKINTEFYRAILKARSGSEWRRPPEVSYDVLNPEKPPHDRATKPYGAPMERGQEKIASTKEQKHFKRPSTVGASSETKERKTPLAAHLPVAEHGVTVINSREDFESVDSKLASRSSTASGRSNIELYDRLISKPARPSTSSSISTIGEDYLLETGRHLTEPLETIQEEEILEQLAPSSPETQRSLRPLVSSRRKRPKLKKPQPPADLFTKKGPDPRFYASKKNLRTPNEMERFRKARGRAFMKNVEQAIPELDYRDHEVKYQPERQLFQDVRWKIRKDVKDVRDKNLHSLVDRFEQRHKIIKEETRTRLGDPTYIGRDPVSVYKLQDATNQARERQPDLGFQVKYPLHNRRRVTPSLGSVQRARNLGSHAQIFNQAIAPPHWGPQRVDHSLFLPQMAQGI